MSEVTVEGDNVVQILRNKAGLGKEVVDDYGDSDYVLGETTGSRLMDNIKRQQNLSADRLDELARMSTEQYQQHQQKQQQQQFPTWSDNNTMSTMVDDALNSAMSATRTSVAMNFTSFAPFGSGSFASGGGSFVNTSFASASFGGTSSFGGASSFGGGSGGGGGGGMSSFGGNMQSNFNAFGSTSAQANFNAFGSTSMQSNFNNFGSSSVTPPISTFASHDVNDNATISTFGGQTTSITTTPGGVATTGLSPMDDVTTAMGSLSVQPLDGMIATQPSAPSMPLPSTLSFRSGKHVNTAVASSLSSMPASSSNSAVPSIAEEEEQDYAEEQQQQLQQQQQQQQQHHHQQQQQEEQIANPIHQVISASSLASEMMIQDMLKIESEINHLEGTSLPPVLPFYGIQH